MSNTDNLNSIYKKSKIAVLGLGYVGLPLALEFAKKKQVIGFDINNQRIKELKKSDDRSLESTFEEINSAKNLTFTSNISDLKDCKIFIVTVPTPIDNKNRPDLNYLIQSCNMIGELLKINDLVIYESTVYPGLTEEICVPILEKISGLVFNRDFYCGYSSERINPGDKNHKLPMIKKVTSGSTDKIANEVDDLYREIIIAGTHKAPSIKVAEAAKVIENIQRDVNIALINEISMILNMLEIDTKSVLDAASTKWNFLNLKPGLVGGHCISVDPYYLLHKALEIGYTPQMITAGRNINDNMSAFIADQVIKLMIRKSIKTLDSNILIMGFTFKENCPDIRNTRVIDLINALKKFKLNVYVYDPLANKDNVLKEYGLETIDQPIKGKYDAIVLAVAHDEFKKLSSVQIKNYGKKNSIIYDIKYIADPENIDGRI